MTSLTKNTVLGLLILLLAPMVVANTKGQALLDDALARKLSGEEQLMRPDDSMRPFDIIGTPRRKGKLHGYSGESLTLRLPTRYRVVDIGEYKELRIEQMWIDWGDGTPALRAPAGATISHVYGDWENPEAKTFRGRITFLVSENEPGKVDSRYTEAFKYNMWDSVETARDGEIQGARDNPYYPEDAVTCDTYAVDGSCTDFTPAEAEFKTHNIAWKTRKGGFNPIDYDYKCLILDLETNKFQAEAVHPWGNGEAIGENKPTHFPAGKHPTHLWFDDARCGSDGWRSIEGSVATITEAIRPTVDDILTDVEECSIEQASADAWLRANPFRPEAGEDEEEPTAAQREYDELREEAEHWINKSCDYDTIAKELTEDDEEDEDYGSTVSGGYDAQTETFTMNYDRKFKKWHGKSGTRVRRYKHHIFSEFMIKLPKIDADLLRSICADGNDSTMQLLDAGKVVAEAGCQNNWQLSVPEAYLKRDAPPVSLELKWRSTRYHVPEIFNKGAGGGMSDTNAELHWWENYGSMD